LRFWTVYPHKLLCLFLSLKLRSVLINVGLFGHLD
jgi:hypothetical protein